MQVKFQLLKNKYTEKKITYDAIYDFFEGWFAHIKHTNTYALRVALAEEIETTFSRDISAKEIRRLEKLNTITKPAQSIYTSTNS